LWSGHYGPAMLVLMSAVLIDIVFPLQFLWVFTGLSIKRDYLKNSIDMPDNLVDLLIRFLAQNIGTLSKRGREREFAKLTVHEILAIEQKCSEIFREPF
jgi:hypothetical protein